MFYKNPIDRFYGFWIISNTGCWEWSRSRNKDGYGHLYCGGRVVSAHRFSWMLFYGPIPKGLCVLHKCDNPTCVNPNHLFLGTQLDNLKDMRAKNRASSNKGNKNPNRKLVQHISHIFLLH